MSVEHNPDLNQLLIKVLMSTVKKDKFQNRTQKTVFVFSLR